MSGLRVTIGPEELLPPDAAKCDADVWKAIAHGGDLVVGEGGPLARWVLNIAHARRWTINHLEDPRRRFREDYPALSPYLEQLMPAASAFVPSSLWAFAEQVLIQLPHESTPSEAHAERIARWRLRNRQISEAEHALLKSAAISFAGPVYETQYRHASHAEMEAIVQSLVGDSYPVFAQEWDPQLEREVADELSVWTRKRLAEVGSKGLDTALTSQSSQASKSVIAQTCADAVTKGLEPDRHLLEIVRPYLTGADLGALSAAIRPDVLRPVPSSESELPEWYESSYLPYRRWMHAREIPSDDAVAPIWAAFAEVYIKAVQKGLGSGQGPLAMHRSRTLKGDEERTLLVILDGLLPDDIGTLLHKLRAKAPEWKVIERDWLLAAVPTITEVCRPSMVRGISAAQVEDDDGAITCLSRVESLFDSGQRMVIVKLGQPDKAYESLNLGQEKLTRLAQAQLEMIADELAAVIRSGALDRIVVTADHGRCFGRVDPIITPCAGKIHRRTIMNVPRDGADLGNHLRRVDGDLLGFDSEFDAAVALGATTFVGANHVWYPHGGLLPEEAFVPWVVLRKVAGRLEVAGTANISGVLGKEGTLAISIQNSSAYAVNLISFEWGENDTMRSADLAKAVVAPGGSRKINLDIPQIAVKYALASKLTISTPDGQLLSLSIPLSVEIRRMQTQSIDLLDDL